MNFIIREAQLSDISDLAARLRAADVKEIYAVSGEDAYTGLSRIFHTSSPSYVFCSGDKAIGIFGMGRFEDDETIASPWLLASEEFYDHQAIFARQSKALFKWFLGNYKFLFNCVDSTNTKAIKWLKWLGFKFVKLHPTYGKHGKNFWEFQLVNPYV
jgi:hypothetical protein